MRGSNTSTQYAFGVWYLINYRQHYLCNIQLCVNVGVVTNVCSVHQVVLRNKRRQVTGERPWSVSGISQLANGTSHAGSEPLANFSISESALHQMIPATSPAGKRGSGANLSSVTIDEVVSRAVEGSGSRNGSLSRRKFRVRKRTLVSTVKEILCFHFLTCSAFYKTVCWVICETCMMKCFI